MTLCDSELLGWYLLDLRRRIVFHFLSRMLGKCRIL